VWDYSEKVMDHFMNPRNVGTMDSPTVVADIGNITCGDALKLYLKIENEVITDAKFKTFGCASAIASSSMLTELIKGKTVDEAAKVTDDDIAKELGGLPEAKMHCSVMGREALEKAIAIYKGEVAPEDVTGRVVCKCFGVTDNKIIAAIRNHDLKTVEQVTHYTKDGGGCGRCKEEIEEIIKFTRVQMAMEAEKKVQKEPPTNLQRVQRVIQVIEEKVRPQLQRDGGDLELIDVVDKNVRVALRGKCVGCIAGAYTLRDVVEKDLRELVDPEITVEEIK